MKLSSLLVSAISGAAVFAAAVDARAEPTDGAFRYTTPAEPDRLRALAEQAIILGVGYVQYTTNESNEEDWDLDADWKTLENKILLDAVSFDNNRFDTNWLTHPVAGYMYYAAARGNRLPIAEAFAYAAVSSTFWEYIGEVREEVAINDVIVTPVTGLALGEPLLQLGAMMHRSKQTPLSVALGWVFAPFKSAHDALDELTPERATELDGLGLPADTWHRFLAGASGGVTRQQDAAARGDGRFALESRVVTLPRYRAPGAGVRMFDAGEVSSLALRGAVSDGDLVDMRFLAHVLPLGVHASDIERTPGGGLIGHSVVAGLPVVAEYGQHDYDRDRRRGEDRIALVATGASIEESAFLGSLAVHGRLDVLVSFAGVDAYGLDEYRALFGDAHLPSVTSRWGYYHAIGGTVRPALEVRFGPLEASGSLRLDWFSSLTDGDVDPIPGGTADRADDRRSEMRVFVGFWLSPQLRVGLALERNERDGRIGAAPRASRSEGGAYGGVDLVF